MTASLTDKIHPLRRSGARRAQARGPKTPAMRRLLLASGLSATLLSSLAPAATVPGAPLIASACSAPMALLVASNDHKPCYSVIRQSVYAME